jgi:hypothetical protein
MSVKHIHRNNKKSSCLKEALLLEKVTSLPLDKSDDLIWEFAESLSMNGWKVKLYLPFSNDLVTVKVRHKKGAKIQ